MEKLHFYVGKVIVFFFYFIFAQDLFVPKYAYSQNNNHLFIIYVLLPAVLLLFYVRRFFLACAL